MQLKQLLLLSSFTFKKYKNLKVLFLFLSLFSVFTVFSQNNESLYPKVTRLEGQGNGGNWLNISDATRNSILSGAPWKVQQVEYNHGTSPVVVRVYNPAELKNYDYRLKIQPHQNSKDNSLVDSAAYWILEWWQDGDLVGSYTSQSAIGDGTEEFLEEHGLAIVVKNRPFVVYDTKLEKVIREEMGGYTCQNNMWYAQPDLIGSAVYHTGAHEWLGGLKDEETDVPANWIRAGQQKSTVFWESYPPVQTGARDDYSLWRKEDFFNLYSSYPATRGFMDPAEQYEDIAGGTWAPYVMSSPYDGGPKAQYVAPDTNIRVEPTPKCYDFSSLASVPNRAGYSQTLANLYSVDIVFTPDTSLWTRALVLEAGDAGEEDNYQVEQHFNGQTYRNIRHEPKNCPSVDKNGNPDNSGTTGYGWFPGYAINVETGERLNIMFAENSADEYNHGNDMLFNPTNVYAFRHNSDGSLVFDANGQPVPMSQAEYDSLYLSVHEYGNTGFVGEPLNGGRHYVYVCGSSGNTANTFYRSNSFERNWNNNNQIIAQQGGSFVGTDGESYPWFDCGVYDEGRWLGEKFKTFVQETDFNNNVRKAKKMQVFNNVMWTGIPMPAVGEEDHWLESEAWVMIRVARPYMFYSSAVGAHPDVVTNNNAPVFAFTTSDVNIAAQVPLFELDSSLIWNNANRLDVNNVDAPFEPFAGKQFFNGQVADYICPKGSGKSSYFTLAFWLGGLDEQDSLHLMAERFRQIGNDSWPGPLSVTDASVDNETTKKWNRTFKVRREDIVEFLANYQDPQYQYPKSIREWPAHGDTLKGQAWNLAPFVDADSNNIYEPAHGDYPDFPGDMAVFFIFNDNYQSHTESGGEPLGTETHVMAYAYNTPDDSIMNNTIFLNYKVFNRSQHDYHDTYIGLWSDWDLGYANDDYVASDIMKNTAYCYNGQDIDGMYIIDYDYEADTVISYGIYDNGYGANWPVQTITLLQGPLMPADGQDNPAYSDSADCNLFFHNGLNEYAINGTSGFGDGIVDNERYGLTGFVYHNNDASVNGDPQNAQEYYWFMSGRWKDGSHLKYGANAHPTNGSSDIDCRFMFAGDQYPCNFNTFSEEIPDSLQYSGGWYEEAVGNVPYDRRGLASIGPFDLEAGGMQEIEFSLVTIPHSLATTRGDINLDELSSVNQYYHERHFTPAITYITNASFCEGESYTFFGEQYDQPGQYSHFIPNADGDIYQADTVYLLYLTMQPHYEMIYAQVMPGQGYNGNGFNISSAQTANLGTYMFTNSVTNVNGCDYVAVLILDVVQNVGVQSFDLPESNFKIYPNPTTNYFIVETDDENLLQRHENVMLFDLTGRLLQSRPVIDGHTTINIEGYPSGTYIVKCGNNVGKVVKR